MSNYKSIQKKFEITIQAIIATKKENYKKKFPNNDFDKKFDLIYMYKVYNFLKRIQKNIMYKK